MSKIVRSKYAASCLVFSLILFYSPHFLMGKEIGRGNLIGFVYGEDKTTPLEGAILLVRNISTGSIYKSEKSDKLGVVKLEGIDEGLYIVGISVEEGDFNFKNFIGIKTNETAKVSFALRPLAQEENTAKKDEECPRGDSYVPEIRGECDEGYKWNPDTERCECKKRNGFLAFFKSPFGLLLLLASTAGAVSVIAAPAEAEIGASVYK